MGEGRGGKERKAFLSFSSLPFSLPSFPFSPRNVRYSGCKKNYDLYPVLEGCTQAPSLFACHAEILLQVERPLYKDLRILSVEENNLRPRVVSWTLVRSRQL